MKSNMNNTDSLNKAVVEILNKKLKSKEYQKSCLLFRTERTILKLEKIEAAIGLIKKNKNDLSTAINAIEDGELKDQLKILKVKAEYKLFLLEIRKNKVNITKIIINQSKLNELDAILLILKTHIREVELQLINIETPLPVKEHENDISFQKNNIDDDYKHIISINLPHKVLKFDKTINTHLKVAS